jgi:G patch domain and KOW motifs-containing protein
MPIEAFGEAMLRGMGWKEGMGVGRNSKGPVAAIEYVPRQVRFRVYGLGFRFPRFRI